MTSQHSRSLELKAEARNALLGHLGTAVSANVFYLLFVLLLNLLISGVLPSQGVRAIILSEVLSVLAGVFTGVFEYGLDSIYMNLQYGQETRFSDLFNGTRENQDKIVRIAAFLSTVRCICTLPAVIAAWTVPEGAAGVLVWVLAGAGLAVEVSFDLTYAMSFFLLLDYPDLKAGEALKRSREVMKGRRGLLFYLELSFLPLWLLAVISFGIAGFWVYAYMVSTETAFYRKIMEGVL